MMKNYKIKVAYALKGEGLDTAKRNKRNFFGYVEVEQDELFIKSADEEKHIRFFKGIVVDEFDSSKTKKLVLGQIMKITKADGETEVVFSFYKLANTQRALAQNFEIKAKNGKFYEGCAGSWSENIFLSWANESDAQLVEFKKLSAQEFENEQVAQFLAQGYAENVNMPEHMKRLEVDYNNTKTMLTNISNAYLAGEDMGKVLKEEADAQIKREEDGLNDAQNNHNFDDDDFNVFVSIKQESVDGEEYSFSEDEYLGSYIKCSEDV